MFVSPLVCACAMPRNAATNNQNTSSRCSGFNKSNTYQCEFIIRSMHVIFLSSV